MPVTAASKIVYPDGSSIETPDVHYGALAQSVDPRLVGIAQTRVDAGAVKARGALWYVEGSAEHVIQTGRPGAAFGTSTADQSGLISLSDLMLATLVNQSDPYRLTTPLYVMTPRVLGRPYPTPGTYKPREGDLEDPFIVNNFSITVPRHPLSDSGQWLLLAQMSAMFYNLKWNAPPPDPNASPPVDEQAQTNLEMRIARRSGDEPTRICYAMGPPQGYLRQTNSHIGVAAVAGDSVLQGDIRALRFPTNRPRDFNVESPAGQCQGWVLGIPMRI
jgi:hypothetical protein